MSNGFVKNKISSIVPRDIDLSAWVEAARSNLDQYRDRQVTEIVLHAIGITPSLRETLVLKGGALMALAYDSVRLTGDLDFTAEAEPDGYEQMFTSDLNKSLVNIPSDLGYIDLLCRVQSVERKPRSEFFEKQNFPALLVRVASALKGTSQERALRDGRAAKVLEVEISFRDPVYEINTMRLDNDGISIRTFDSNEIVAEKIRALLQQKIRNRTRRQDVYDISYLMEKFENDLDASLIKDLLIKKCENRGINPTNTSMRDPIIKEMASRNWHTLQDEVDFLPDFEVTYEKVARLYESLPW